jgi:hypothetical protein
LISVSGFNKLGIGLCGPMLSRTLTLFLKLVTLSVQIGISYNLSAEEPLLRQHLSIFGVLLLGATLWQRTLKVYVDTLLISTL